MCLTSSVKILSFLNGGRLGMLRVLSSQLSFSVKEALPLLLFCVEIKVFSIHAAEQYVLVFP
jgi:hypothetical protein